MKDFYADYYDGSETEWRRLGAIDKAANLQRLWTEHADSSEKTRVVEIGCGDGAVLAEVCRRGFIGEGVEISMSGVAAARARGLTVTLLEDPRTEFADNTFDVALITHVVEHLECPRQTLLEAARIARWVAVEVPLEYRWRTPHDFEPNEIGHINLYNMKLIRHLLQSCGLAVIGERVSNPSREVHEYDLGAIKGRLRWGAREGALRLVPSVAQKVFTYHGTLLCATADR